MKLKLDLEHILMLTHLLESIVMDLGDGMQKVFRCIARSGNLGILLLWHILHLIISIWYLALRITHAIESYLISNGFFKRYRALEIGKLRYLAIVIDSEEAHQTLRVIELLRWLAAIGVKHVCLYDTQGVLKKSKEVMGRLSDAKSSEEGTKIDPFLGQKLLTLEFASFSDGKEAVAKAANLLFVKYYSGGDNEKPIFTESHMSEALRAIDRGGSEPDLMLVYGPARCHLGFPAWRIRYTEIVHMGPLKSMKYGSLIKTIHKFTMVRQNYGK